MTKQKTTHGGKRPGAGRPATGKRQVTVTVSSGPLKGMSGKQVRAAAEWAVAHGWDTKKTE